MMIKKILDLYIYSSFHIALCASAMVWSSYYMISEYINWDFVVYAGSSTWLLYSLHRIIGIRKVKDSRHENRFELIRKYRTHLIIYASISICLCIFFFFRLDFIIQSLLVIAALPALAYVLPIFRKKLRLRDFNYIKIFLVAGSWGFIIGTIPAIDMNLSLTEIILFSIEKTIFIFAITLPFDYRDRIVDLDSGVRTLAHLFEQKTFIVIGISFLLAVLFVWVSPMYDLNLQCILTGIYIIISGITLYASRFKHDYYFSGLIDGTMILFAGMLFTLFTIISL